MKYFLFIAGFALMAASLLAQTPKAINYQAVVRTTNGHVLSDRNLNIHISIQKDSIGGTVVYSEDHNLTTNTYGLANLAIGDGTVLSGIFDSIAWGSSLHFIKIEMDTSGGTGFQYMGTSQLLSVPYALYADKVASVNDTDIQHWNTAFSWGDHALAGYLTGYTETDPIFGLSPANTISAADILNWKTAYGWGNHALSGYLTSETDPKVGANTLNFIPKWNGNALTSSSIIETDNEQVGIGTTWVDSAVLLHVAGIIRADSAIKVNDATGKSDTVNQITAFDFNSDKLKYRTYIYLGGILTYISDESSWVDSVGDFILPDEPPLPQSCPGIPTITYEGQIYSTLLIGTQCWLKENLNVGSMIISNEAGHLQTDNSMIEKYCQNNDPAYCGIYGGLYEWEEALQYILTEGTQGICPAGWHIPSDNDWKILEGNVDGLYPVGDPTWNIYGWRGLDAGGNLKEDGTSHWISPNVGATNSSGFTALPGGARNGLDGFFEDMGVTGGFWTSSTNGSESGIYRLLDNEHMTIRRQNTTILHGYSVRCLKNP